MSASSVQALAERKNRQVSELLNTVSTKESRMVRCLELKNADVCVPCVHPEDLYVLRLAGGWQVLYKSGPRAPGPRCCFPPSRTPSASPVWAPVAPSAYPHRPCTQPFSPESALMACFLFFLCWTPSSEGQLCHELFLNH